MERFGNSEKYFKTLMKMNISLMSIVYISTFGKMDSHQETRISPMRTPVWQPFIEKPAVTFREEITMVSNRLLMDAIFVCERPD